MVSLLFGKFFVVGIFLLINSLVWATPGILITEIAPSEPGGDWIEFFVSEDTNLIGINIYEGKSLVKTLPELSLKKYSYILLHFNSANPDEDTLSGDVNGNKVWDLYLQDSGLTATDNVISIRENETTWIDAVCFSNRDGTMSKTARTAFNQIPTGFWNDKIVSADGTNDSLIQNCMVDWSQGKEGKSLARDTAAQLLPLDTNTQKDWNISTSPTPGQGYLKGNSEEPKTYNPVVTEKTLEIQEPNPFSPHQGEQAYFAYHLPAEAIKSLSIYDVSGMLVRKVIDQVQDGLSYGIISWNGRNENGEIVPVGIYIVYLEAKVGNSVTKASDVVVVGRKF